MQEIPIALIQFHTDIDERVTAIRGGHPDWPCAKGCGDCCRQLADIPRCTEAEWQPLREALSALPAERLAEIRHAVAALAASPVGPVVCPLLDRATSSCPVYAARPVACRSYGFYVERGTGLYCSDIEARTAAGEFADVVWGNQEVVEQRLARLGESRPLTEWFAHWIQDGRTPA